MKSFFITIHNKIDLTILLGLIHLDIHGLIRDDEYLGSYGEIAGS